MVTEGGQVERYQRLDPDAVGKTVHRLHHRILTRFPERGLARVAGELADLVTTVGAAEEESRRQHRTLRTLCRAGIAVVAVVAVAALVLVVVDAVDNAGSLGALTWVPLLESLVNDLVFAAIAVFFLQAVPSRLHRTSTLRLLHRLRSLAHVIDMHQLTKDPERLLPSFQPTSASVPLRMTSSELANYLDYCSELLSLVSKTAALCAEDSTDQVVLDTVSNLETLTLGMSRKIWQKISVLHADSAAARG